MEEINEKGDSNILDARLGDLKINRVIETVLYCDDVSEMLSFYQEIFNFKLLMESSERGAFLSAGESVLILFNRTLTSVEGQKVPSHGASGVQHLAFEVDGGQLEDWKKYFNTKGIKIEKEIHWEHRNAHSIYFRDPAGHSIELTEVSLWKK